MLTISTLLKNINDESDDSIFYNMAIFLQKTAVFQYNAKDNTLNVHGCHKKFRNSVVRNLAPNSASFGGFCGKFRVILGFLGEIPYHFGALPKIPRHFGDLAAEFRLRNDNCKPPRVKRYFWRLKHKRRQHSTTTWRYLKHSRHAVHHYFPC